MLAFGTIPRFGRRELLAVAILAILILAFLPIVVRKAVWLGQGDVQVPFPRRLGRLDRLSTLPKANTYRP